MSTSKEKKEKNIISSRMNEYAIRLIEGIAVYENRTVSKVTANLIENGLRQYLRNNTDFRNSLLGFDLIPDFKEYVQSLCEIDVTNENDKIKSLFDFINQHSGLNSNL